MKKLVLILVFAVIAGCGWAQNGSNSNRGTSSREAKHKVVFGFKGGINRSDIYAENSHDFIADGKTGAVAGGFLCIPFGDFIGFQPEVLFSQKGFSGVGDLSGNLYQLKRTTNYLDVPLQLQLKPFAWFSMLAGVQYSYLLKQRDEFVYTGNSDQIRQQFSSDVLRKHMAGVVVGGDLNFWHIVVSGRAGWDILKNNSDGNSLTPRYKNLWFQGTIGYRVY
jgi:hypothetical protein